MSELNRKQLSEGKKNSDFINIDESGKVVIKDEGLAQINDELSPEELEEIAGAGPINGDCDCDCDLE